MHPTDKLDHKHSNTDVTEEIGRNRSHSILHLEVPGGEARES